MNSTRSRISLVWAMASNRVIGANNALPWRLPADLRYFRRLTLGHHVIMGRRNYESLGRPLPGRDNIVITRQADYRAPGCAVVGSVEEALRVAATDPEIFVIGGATLYAQTLALADRLYATLIDAQVAGDTLFPEFDTQAWIETAREQHLADADNPFNYCFVTWERPLAPSDHGAASGR
ncbi:MAG: type 3 dihydrofolate reductase [Gammaproteobacteria bacterium]|nr:type 3 dihydrofolate reductase [Gammaproteobacteria bacterium]